MREVAVHKIKIDENHNEQVIVLKTVNGNTVLPLVIGIAEVHAIKMKLSGIEPPRPLTHDLLRNTIESLGGIVEYVVIDNVDKRTFYAKVVISVEGRDDVRIDARPSDGIALALRAQVPIFVEERVLEEAGVA